MRKNFIAKEKGAVSFDNQLLRGKNVQNSCNHQQGVKVLKPDPRVFFFLRASLSAAKCEPESR